MRRVIVVGAGVVGLSTAVRLLEAGPAPDSRWRVRAELPVGEPENAGSVG